MRPRSRPAPGAGQGGDSYLASVSDLVSALIFVFIIMLAVFAYQLANVTEGLTAADETRRQMLDAIRDRLQISGIRVQVLYEQGVLRLSENAINFPSGVETPIVGHHPNVGHLARAIAEVVPCYVLPSGGVQAGPVAAERATHCQTPANPANYACQEVEFPWLLETLLIEGHTDSVPVAPGNRFRDNLELSSMRAATVHRMITACEPSMDHLGNTQSQPILSTSGYGSARPVTLDVERAGENRRIDLRFLLEPPADALPSTEMPVQTGVRERYEELDR